MNVIIRNFWFLLTGLAVWIISAPANSAGQEVCNETSFIIYSAVAFTEQDLLISEGWTRLRAGECRTILPEPVPKGDIFIFARSSDAHRGGIRKWAGLTSICVDQENFSVTALANCETLGLDSRNFRKINNGSSTERKTSFTEVEEFKERAALAGLQRLLMDNGQDIRKVDGYAGRRTRIAISKYLKEMKVARRPNDPNLMDMLEKSARKNKHLTGLEVCNDADGTLWLSYAKRQNKQWESRGWWTLQAGLCVSLLSEPLSKNDKFYLYANLVEEGNEMLLEQGDETFCISRVKFSIFGRYTCAVRGYSEAKFMKVQPETGQLTRIRLEAEDFVGSLSASLKGDMVK
ncbi:MAG: DUF1036 domain-containing protein [Robiginitomaculum sp.]|nr:DUF1036 domain-containing protein [Robiginitomaculum sp.]